MSRFSFLDPIFPSANRSNLRQSLLHFARGRDPANAHYGNLAAPILLIGSARGGTTLLSNIVGAHPRVLIFNERFTPGKQSYRDTFGASTEPQALARAFLQFIPHHVKTRDLHWGVKICTHHWSHTDLERFLESFPRLQIIFVIRDGRDVVLSMLERSLELKTGEQCVQRWLQSVQVLDYLRAQLPDHFLTYRYEDLVAKPEPQVRAICAFLGEPFYPPMLEHTSWPGHGRYEIAPVRADRVGKWLNQELPALPADVQQQFEAGLAQLGYLREATFPP